MPYTRVTRTANGADAIMYARGFGRGHDGSVERNIYVAGVNMLPDSAVPFEEQMRPYWNRASRRHTTQVDRFILSFATEELDPGKPEDCLKALEIAREFAREIAPYSQAAVFVQADGKGGKLHVHVLVNDVCMDDGKGIDSSAYYFPHFSAVADRLCAKYFELKQPEPGAEKVSQTVRAKREENKRIRAENAVERERAEREGLLPDPSKLKEPVYVWQDDLRGRIRRAADGAADEEDFARRLRLDGVELVPRARKDGTLSYRRPATKTFPEEYYVYELVDVGGFDGKIPPNLKSRSYKLGADFMPDAVAKLFQPRAQAGAEQEDVIHVPESPKPRKPAKEQAKPEPGVPEKPKPADPEMERAIRTAKQYCLNP